MSVPFHLGTMLESIHLAPLWSLPDTSFVRLQKGPGEADAQFAAEDQPLLNLGPELQDSADIAGALGTPCWVLLAATTEWRWTRGPAGSPRYSHSMRLFRQADPSNWTGVIEQVCEAYRSAPGSLLKLGLA